MSSAGGRREHADPVDTLKYNGIPLYHQLKEIFAEKIATGAWPVGQAIPNELTLCQYYHVSRGPVRQALDQLVREGLLSRKQGKGTFVLPPKIESGLSGFYSFTTLIAQRGMRPGVRLLAFDIVPPPGSVGQLLQLSAGGACYRIRRLRLADDEPLILETVFVPQDVCGALTAEQVALRPLYDLLAAEGLALRRAKQFFEPTVADEYEAQMLGIATGAPALLVQNITYTADERPVVLSKAIMRGDRVRYYVELSAQIALP